MVKRIFTVLQQKDEQGFIQLFPDAATTREFVVKMLGNDKSEEAMPKEMMDELLGKLTDSSLLAKFREAYAETIEKGEMKGIEWAKTTFDSHVADSSFDAESGMGTMEGKIYFSTAKEKYFLSFNQVIWFENKGWYGVDIDRIDELSKENEEQIFDVMIDTTSAMPGESMVMFDSAVAVADSVAKEAPQKPLNKTTPVKPAGKPGKVKSQTPARKPE